MYRLMGHFRGEDVELRPEDHAALRRAEANPESSFAKTLELMGKPPAPAKQPPTFLEILQSVLQSVGPPPRVAPIRYPSLWPRPPDNPTPQQTAGPSKGPADAPASPTAPNPEAVATTNPPGADRTPDAPATADPGPAAAPIASPDTRHSEPQPTVDPPKAPQLRPAPSPPTRGSRPPTNPTSRPSPRPHRGPRTLSRDPKNPGCKAAVKKRQHAPKSVPKRAVLPTPNLHNADTTAPDSSTDEHRAAPRTPSGQHQSSTVGPRNRQTGATKLEIRRLTTTTHAAAQRTPAPAPADSKEKTGLGAEIGDSSPTNEPRTPTGPGSTPGRTPRRSTRRPPATLLTGHRQSATDGPPVSPAAHR
ncbi:proline-rich receptor-like protein kinase PERK2 [Leguminivora glycinivorella]|uniref:proline-rich receptor-like protein kinase PERK2 n=1 Tax=Leguminivora glycinivorella TaxID=1035111 RepID=UPI00200FAC25|nr:proline-rich receptor-like protein kinase PERK2 [Leguminivora glycinivorella]